MIPKQGHPPEPPNPLLMMNPQPTTVSLSARSRIHNILSQLPADQRSEVDTLIDEDFRESGLSCVDPD